MKSFGLLFVFALSGCIMSSMKTNDIQRYSNGITKAMLEYTQKGKEVCLYSVISYCDSALTILDANDGWYYTYFSNTKSETLFHLGKGKEVIDNEIRYHESLNKESLEYLRWKSMCYWIREDTVDAYRYCQKAIKAIPNPIKGSNRIREIAICYICCGRDNNAKKVLREYLANQEDPSIRIFYDGYEDWKEQLLKYRILYSKYMSENK